MSSISVMELVGVAGRSEGIQAGGEARAWRVGWKVVFTDVKVSLWICFRSKHGHSCC